jgi:hypothetical protein
MKAKPIRTTDNRHQVFLQVLDLLWSYTGEDLRALAERSGLHWTTIYKWQRGETYAPRLDKIAAVAAALGYTVALKRTPSTAPTLRSVK